MFIARHGFLEPRPPVRWGVGAGVPVALGRHLQKPCEQGGVGRQSQSMTAVRNGDVGVAAWAQQARLSGDEPLLVARLWRRDV